MSTPDIARVISAGNASPAPTPRSSIGANRSAAEAAVDRRAGEEQQAERRARASAGISTGLGPKRMFTRSETFRDIVPIATVAGRNASPTSSGS